MEQQDPWSCLRKFPRTYDDQRWDDGNERTAPGSVRKCGSWKFGIHVITLWWHDLLFIIAYWTQLTLYNMARSYLVSTNNMYKCLNFIGWFKSLRNIQNAATQNMELSSCKRKKNKPTCYSTLSQRNKIKILTKIVFAITDQILISNSSTVHFVTMILIGRIIWLHEHWLVNYLVSKIWTGQ